jgi:hypothetical protein
MHYCSSFELNCELSGITKVSCESAGFEDRHIEPSAMYYTEPEAMEQILALQQSEQIANQTATMRVQRRIDTD